MSQASAKIWSPFVKANVSAVQITLNIIIAFNNENGDKA